MFYGSIPALVTPFRDGALDLPAFERLIDWHLDSGSHGLVIAGTTGESPTLSHDEKCEMFRIAIARAGGRIPVICATGSNDTAASIALTREAEAMGADGGMLVCPYYNKPGQAGLAAHFEAIHRATESLPLLVYNVPGRCGTRIELDTMVELMALERMVGVKDATGDLALPLALRHRGGPEIVQLSGEDATVAAFLAQGGHGCISVTANVAPRESAQLFEAWVGGDFERFERLRDRLAPLHEAMFAGPSPAPAKHALWRLGRIRDELRLPLVPVAAPVAARVEAVLADLGVLAAGAA